MDEKKEIKQVKSYSLPPSQIAWLREQAAQEATAGKTVSASNVLERLISDAMSKKIGNHMPSSWPTNSRS